jgi:HEAT repeat
LSQLSKQGKAAKLSDVALLMTIIDDFRHLLGSAIPGIFDLLKDNNWEVCQAGADALSQLSEHCKISSTASLSRVGLLM